MNSRIKTQHTSKLFFSQFASKAVLDYAVVLQDLAQSFPKEDSGRIQGQWRNLITPFRISLSCDTLPDTYPSYVSEYLVRQVKAQCNDVITWYRSVVLSGKPIEKSMWSVDPSYIGKGQNEAAVIFRLHLYFKDNDGAKKFVEKLEASNQLDLFRDVSLHNIPDQALESIKGDPRVVAVKKYPYGKYTGKIWLNSHRLGKLSSEKRTQILNVLDSYEESGLLRCQPLLTSFLKGERRFLWTDPYFYTLTDDIKTVLDLVLVNIVSKQERIVLYG